MIAILTFIVGIVFALLGAFSRDMFFVIAGLLLMMSGALVLVLKGKF